MLKLAGALCFTGFVAWLAWGIYTINHAADPITWGYSIGSSATTLGPLAVALVILARHE